jgi:SsrA-binding protein
MKIHAQNKKAFHDYEVLDRIEVGIVLNGDEVKSIKAGHLSLVGSYAVVHSSEIFLINCMITPYAKAYLKQDDKATRSRKLLMHKREMTKLIGDISKKGITLIPLKIYSNEKNYIKLDLGICKHKKASERKEELRERDIKRETARELRKKY